MLPDTCLQLLHRWKTAAERDWYQLPDNPELGCYGTGYDQWGVQTNQKYVVAMAALGVYFEESFALARALAALRYSLSSHQINGGTCTDARAWGRTWISPLGIERMMVGVYLLEPFLSDEDKASLRRVLVDEADWQCYHHARGNQQGPVGGVWGKSGRNNPESNLWVGAILWRVACMYPDHPHAGDWRETAHRYLINSVSVAADAADEGIVAGKPVRERHVGPNFFPHYSLDHHGYLNVGYQVICVSNAAMLYFDLATQGWEVPDSLWHHQRDLWRTIRRTLFQNGRLARIGGDSRVRYTYCQEYLLPSLLFAAAKLDDPEIGALIPRQLALIRQEQQVNGDGSFYGKRLAHLAGISPYYYTRLESDRACVLGMLATWMTKVPDALTTAPPAEPNARDEGTHVDLASLERSLAGGWAEPEHGAVLHRSPTRLAAFVWPAFGLAQGTCIGPDDGHATDWQHNLAGVVRFMGDDGINRGIPADHRQLIEHRIEQVEGGFLTWGTIAEGTNVFVPEGWNRQEPCGEHRIVFAALPDAHTVVGLQLCRTLDFRTYTLAIKGLHLNLPNDLYNDFRREVETADGSLTLTSPPTRDEVVPLGGKWAAVEGRFGVVGLYGADYLSVHRTRQRRGGTHQTLFNEEICFPCRLGPQPHNPRSIVLDAGWTLATRLDAPQTMAVARTARVWRPEKPLWRAVAVTAQNGSRYLVAANFGDRDLRLPDDVGGEFDLPAGQAIMRQV